MVRVAHSRPWAELTSSGLYYQLYPRIRNTWTGTETYKEIYVGTGTGRERVILEKETGTERLQGKFENTARERNGNLMILKS